MIIIHNMLLVRFALSVICGSSKAQFTQLGLFSFYYIPSLPFSFSSNPLNTAGSFMFGGLLVKKLFYPRHLCREQMP